jgi:SH3-like domain-containing protein
MARWCAPPALLVSALVTASRSASVSPAIQAPVGNRGHRSGLRCRRDAGATLGNFSTAGRYINLDQVKIDLRLRCMLLLTVALLPGCGRGRRVQEVAYVSAPQAILRDQVAAVYNKAGVVQNAERVQVLDRDRRFARVRTSSGAEGWMEQRYLVNQNVYDSCLKLTKQEQNSPVQAAGTTRTDTNIHLDPARDADHLYQLSQGAKVSILKRASSEKILPGAPAKAATLNNPKPGMPAMEDWWLIRDAQGHVGWVLSKMVDLDVPLEIAQYDEGQRVIAFFPLDEVTDGDKKVPQYLVVYSESKEGLPFDFNQARVFTWNLKRHRYETAYRERNLNGMLPVTISQENSDKEGTLPVFVLRVNDESGNTQERKYKLSTPIVRRVLAPGEAKPVSKPKRKAG